jgi:diguanylate cyclase (GGDEF)-like protein
MTKRNANARKTALDENGANDALELLRSILDSVPIGMMIFDADEMLVMVNKAMRNHPNPMFKAASTHGQGNAPISFEETIRSSMRQGLFVLEKGREEEWLAERLAQFRAADGQPRQGQNSTGHYIQYSDHRTPHGYTVCARWDITEQKLLENRLHTQSITDPLTSLPNRRHFMQQLENELDRVRRQSSYEVCVLMLDMDFFKRINDEYGHPAGDALLQHFSALLRETLRRADFAGRLGGEEFAVILSGCGTQAALAWGQRLRAAMATNPLNWQMRPINVTVSIGVTAITRSDHGIEPPLSRADKALYQAKQNGRNRVEICSAASPSAAPDADYAI